MNKLVLLLTMTLLCASWQPLMAKNATINGILIDANDTTTLIGATVRLLKADKDSTYVDAMLSDENGVFTLKNVKAGKYYLKCSYIGYDTDLKRITIGSDGRDVNLGVIKMNPNSIMLKETVVIGVKTPITVKEDTIEYNADTYKTQANAVVEDLLKRLPGVEVGSDGKITANGKSVSKILIDGKEFFSDDPTVASKNIPADMVDKLQVIDRKSDLARLTGVDDGEDETVINLTVKKGMNNGWFGTANAGYGTDDRFATSVIANYFNDGNQYTLMAGGNNTNSLGFTDGGAQRFRRFGASNGITRSAYAGFNFNVGSSKDEHFRAGGDLMYSYSDRDTRTRTNRQYLFADSTSYYNAASTSRDKGNNLRGDFRIKWELDPQSTLEFRPNFSLNFSNSVKSDSSWTRAGDALLSPVNRSLSSYDNDGKSYEFGGQIVFNHKFAGHPGRSYSAQLRYNFSDVREDGNTFTQNTYYLHADSTETIDQIYENHTRTNGLNGRVTWTEPLGDIANARFLTLAYMGNYRYSKADKMTYDITRATTPQLASAAAPFTAGYDMNGTMLGVLYDKNLRDYIAGNYGNYALTDGVMLSQILEFELGPELERTFNERLSNRFRNTYFNQSFELGFRQVRTAYNLNVGLSVNSAMSNSENLLNSDRNIPSRWVWSVAPFARLRYKFTKTRNLSFDYRMRSTQPSMTQLQPVADESNPLNIVVGNPSLKPTFTHRVNLRFSDFAQGSQRSIMAMLGVNFAQNSIISTTDYNSETGGRTTTYANVNGVWDAMGMNMVSFPFGSQKVFYFTNQFFARYAVTKGYNNGEYNRSETFSFNESPGIAFRNSVFDIELRPRYSYQTTHNTVNVANNRDIHTYGGQFNGTYNAPFGLVLSTDLSYSSTSGYSAGYNTTQWLWNASVAYQFLSGRQASVQLSVFDILGQRKSINRNVTANYIEDLAYNSLTRYAMLTFTYKFTTFKKGEQPKTKDYGGYGPDGERRQGDGGGRRGGPPGGGPGGPMGGPPRF